MLPRATWGFFILCNLFCFRDLHTGISAHPAPSRRHPRCRLARAVHFSVHIERELSPAVNTQFTQQFDRFRRVSGAVSSSPYTTKSPPFRSFRPLASPFTSSGTYSLLPPGHREQCLCVCLSAVTVTESARAPRFRAEYVRRRVPSPPSACVRGLLSVRPSDRCGSSPICPAHERASSPQVKCLSKLSLSETG